MGAPDEYCASCPTFSSSVICFKRASTRLSMAGSVRGELVRATGLLAGSGACARTVSNGLKLTKAKRNVATKRDLRSHWQEFQDMGREPSAEHEIAYGEVGANCKSNFLPGCQITIHFGHTSKRRCSLPRPSRLSAIGSDSPLTPGDSRKLPVCMPFAKSI